jgi:hypothetical protein
LLGGGRWLLLLPVGSERIRNLKAHQTESNEIQNALEGCLLLQTATSLLLRDVIKKEHGDDSKQEETSPGVQAIGMRSLLTEKLKEIQELRSRYNATSDLSDLKIYQDANTALLINVLRYFSIVEQEVDFEKEPY